MPEAATVNVALAVPPTMVVLVGIDRTAVPPDKLTTAPAVGAALLSVTVQVADLPLGRLAGLQAKLIKLPGALSESVADCVTPLAAAVITAD